MGREHIDLFEMCRSGVDDLDVRKANGHVSRLSNPQVPLAQQFLKDGVACRLR